MLAGQRLHCASVPHAHATPPSPQDLLCAATHSRAAYGFALEAGFMADVASYIRLQTVQQLT